MNDDGVVNILDISRVAKAFGSSSGDARWDSECDFDGNNVINILDIATVAKDFGRHC